MRVRPSHLWKIAVPVLVLGALAALVVYWPEPAQKVAAEGEWTCSMHPQIRQPKPGSCPICGMDLVPVSQKAAEEERLKAAGVETEPVSYRELFKEVRTVGKLDYAESRVSYVTARISGRLDRLYADFTGITVRKGDHLADIYSPELYVAQGELHRALEAAEKSEGDRTFASATLEAARTKLRL